MRDLELARQLVDYVEATTTPLHDPRTDPQIDLPNQEAIMLTPRSTDTERSPKRSAMLAVAASIAVVIAGLVVISQQNDGSEPADQPAPTTAVVETTPTTALSGDGSDAAPFDAAVLTAVGERMVTALDTDDPDTLVQLVSDNADPISVFGVTSRADLVSLFGWINASDWRFEPQACEASEPDRVECTVLQSNAWATAAGAEPVEGKLFLRVENGQVAAMRYGSDNSFTEYFEDFYGFVRDRDPDDAAAMWATAGDGRTIWPTLTDESFELFEQYTADYVESRTDSTTPVDET
jgi:hypothetical protein